MSWKKKKKKNRTIEADWLKWHHGWVAGLVYTKHWERDRAGSFRDLSLDYFTLASCLILAEFLKFSKSQFPYPETENDNDSFQCYNN